MHSALDESRSVAMVLIHQTDTESTSPDALPSSDADRTNLRCRPLAISIENVKKHFSLLIATPELLMSPLIKEYAGQHDQVVTTATRHVLQFRVENPTTSKSKPLMYILYDNERLEVCSVSIVNGERRETCTTVVACFIPREVGSTEFTFSDTADAKRKLSIVEYSLLGNSMATPIS